MRKPSVVTPSLTLLWSLGSVPGCDARIVNLKALGLLARYRNYGKIVHPLLLEGLSDGVLLSVMSCLLSGNALEIAPRQ